MVKRMRFWLAFLLRLLETYASKNSKNLHFLDIQACNSANKLSIQNLTKAFNGTQEIRVIFM